MSFMLFGNTRWLTGGVLQSNEPFTAVNRDVDLKIWLYCLIRRTIHDLILLNMAHFQIHDDCNKIKCYGQYAFFTNSVFVPQIFIFTGKYNINNYFLFPSIK